MYGLVHYKYANVPARTRKASYFVIHPDHVDSVIKNASFVKYLLENYKRSESVENIVYFHERRRENFPALGSLEEALSYLGLSTLDISNKSFLDLETRIHDLEKTELNLIAEKFFAPPFVHQGSSRHVLLYDCQLKGCGRNSLVADIYHDHSWGGFSRKDALASYILGLLIEKKALLPPLRTSALLIYDDAKATQSSALALREATSFRLSQIHPAFFTSRDRSLALENLFKLYPNMTSEEIFQKIIQNFVEAFANGLFYRSISWDNLVLDGRWIDSESVSVDPEEKPYPFIELLIPFEDYKLEVGKNLEDFISAYPKLYFYNSWVNHLHVITKMYKSVFEVLWPDEKLNSEEAVIRSLKQTSLSELCNEWSPLLKSSSFLENFLFSPMTEDLEEFNSKKFLPPNYFATSQRMDQLGRGYVVTFCNRPDPLAASRLMVEKISTFIETVGVTVEEAINNHHKINLLIQKFGPKK